ncbi:unnamed protein product [Ilex paraguariensis]|uniref:Uncharacterized protein n=1 Tax=Ilex paraguariensis TaxID=185542 RepID=A0ABC8QW56_9AQUA
MHCHVSPSSGSGTTLQPSLHTPHVPYLCQNEPNTFSYLYTSIYVFPLQFKVNADHKALVFTFYPHSSISVNTFCFFKSNFSVEMYLIPNNIGSWYKKRANGDEDDDDDGDDGYDYVPAACKERDGDGDGDSDDDDGDYDYAPAA